VNQLSKPSKAVRLQHAAATMLQTHSVHLGKGLELTCIKQHKIFATAAGLMLRVRIEAKKLNSIWLGFLQ